jgi:hypothetical protein
MYVFKKCSSTNINDTKLNGTLLLISVELEGSLGRCIVTNKSDCCFVDVRFEVLMAVKMSVLVF